MVPDGSRWFQMVQGRPRSGLVKTCEEERQLLETSDKPSHGWEWSLLTLQRGIVTQDFSSDLEDNSGGLQTGVPSMPPKESH